MAPEVRALTGAALANAMPDVARLRIDVFREWPYLYDGDLAYEERYLAPYATAPDAIVVGAFEGDRLVGASTGMPLSAHAEDFAAAFTATELDMARVFYCAESVLLPDFRGRGIGHRFFDLREDFARRRGFSTSAFCAVIRPGDHPAKPPGYKPLDAFWRGRGYAPLPGAIARFSWKDLGAETETEKPLQVWTRPL
ncbi:MAG: GNAT family N-acetyltransferase [Roseobacter sp.]|jgi:GNAT superfamily N-acetyltransferase